MSFEAVDHALLRKILEAPSCTPTPMLYLELGCVPIRYIIMSRRLIYLQYLLQEDENSLLHRFFLAQLENPVQSDWTIQVKKDLEEVALGASMEEIKMMTKESFKERVKASVIKAAFNYLTEEKRKLSKIMYIAHSEFKLQAYFNPMSMDVHDAKFLFLLRSRMVEVRTNFRNKYSDILCPVCKLFLSVVRWSRASSIIISSPIILKSREQHLKCSHQCSA